MTDEITVIKQRRCTGIRLSYTKSLTPLALKPGERIEITIKKAPKEADN